MERNKDIANSQNSARRATTSEYVRGEVGGQGNNRRKTVANETQ
jgi:hypothetical protein